MRQRLLEAFQDCFNDRFDDAVEDYCDRHDIDYFSYWKCRQTNPWYIALLLLGMLNVGEAMLKLQVAMKKSEP